MTLNAGGSGADIDALARVRDDPAFQQRLRAAYEGTGDPVDRLWWRVHPGEPTPSGRVDPAERRRDLAAEAYGVDGATAARARKELARLDEQDAAADRALDGALAMQRSRPPQRRRREPRAIVALIAVGALIVGFGAGTTLARTAPAGAPPSPTPTASDVQMALGRPRAPGDSLPDAVRGAVDRKTSRLVSVLTRSDEPGGAAIRVFLARGSGAKQVCLIVVPAGTSPSTLCLTLRVALTERVVLSTDGPPLVPSSIVLNRGDIQAEFS